MEISEEDDLLKFGRKIRELRKQKKMTQLELAKDAKIHKNYLGKIERGKTNFSAATMFCLVHSLGVAFTDFFND